ncbi:hypothetical protein Tco_0495911 [Tanacetum coccineum]
MEDGIFFNQSKYIKEMLKKFGLEDSKPTKTPMSTEIKLTKDDEADSVDSSKYQGDYVDRKSTSGVCTFMGCCLTSWFAKKQTALAISTTEAEYVFAGKACQQALWMKQALIDYGIRLDNVPIMCDNKGAIDLSKNPVQHSRTKHIEIRHHFLRDNVQKGNISIEKVASEDNIADIFTKPLKRKLTDHGRKFNFTLMIIYRMEEVIKKCKGLMPFAMLLTRLYNHILATSPQAIVSIARFTFHEHVMDPLDISRNPSIEKGKKITSPRSSSLLSSSSDDNEAPSFLKFYDELSDSEDLTNAQ